MTTRYVFTHFYGGFNWQKSYSELPEGTTLDSLFSFSPVVNYFYSDEHIAGRTVNNKNQTNVLTSITLIVHVQKTPEEDQIYISTIVFKKSLL